MSLEADIEHIQGTFRLKVSFRSEGRLTALFGRSGSGKTTLVNIVAGLARPNVGRIVVDGAVLVDTAAGIFVPKHRRRIGYVFQEGRLFPHLTVRQNLTFGRWFKPRDTNAAVGFDSVVELLGIGNLLQSRPGKLSGGEKQRVAIGRALLAHPRLLLMDEPFASLDEERKADILPYIERLRDEIKVPIVYVSHNVAEVARLATTVVVLEEGGVAAVGATGDIFGGRMGLASLVADKAAGTALSACVASQDERFELTTLDTPVGHLIVPRLNRAIGTTVRIMVPARDVILSLDKPSGVSTLNVLPAIVAEVGADVGAWTEVRLRCGDAHLLSRVTRRSVEALALTPGRKVFALVKTVALEEGAGGRISSNIHQELEQEKP